MAAPAVQVPPEALVLWSPFTELADAAATRFRWLPVRWLLRDGFAVRAPVSRLTVPVTVVYGEHDTLVPPDQSRAAAAAAATGTALIVPGRTTTTPPGFTDRW